LTVEFELPPGTHARIGASPASEVTLPLTGIAPFWCMIGRFQDGRLFLADPNGLILRRIDLPETLSLAPYQFVVFNPADAPPPPPQVEVPVETKNPTSFKVRALVTGILVGGLAGVVAVGQCRKPATVPAMPMKVTPPIVTPTATPAPPVTKAAPPRDAAAPAPKQP
jgi:hypothetical protein